MAKVVKDENIYSSVSLGNYTTVGESTNVRLTQIGNRVTVGSHCELGEMSTINDCCVVEDNTHIPARMVIPPYSRVSGVPLKDFRVEELGPGYRKMLESDSRMRHVLG